MENEEPIIFHDVKYGTPQTMDAEEQAYMLGYKAGQSSRPQIKWPDEESTHLAAESKDCYTHESKRGFFSAIEWLKSFVEKGIKE